MNSYFEENWDNFLLVAFNGVRDRLLFVPCNMTPNEALDLNYSVP